MANEMNPTEWGWKQENGQLIPIITKYNAAPVPRDANPRDVAVDALDSPWSLCILSK